MPVESLPFVPRGVVEDEDVPFPGRSDRSCRLVEEDLEDLGIAVACFDGEEFTGAGAHGSKDVEADMITIMYHAGLRSLDRPAPAGFRLSVYPCFVAVPQLCLFVFRKVRK